MTPLSVLAASHHLGSGTITVIVVAAISTWILIAIALPTRKCARCHGDRVQFTRHWLTGRARTRPCRRCTGTGRTPRLGAPTIHRFLWSVRQERNKP